MPSKINSRFAYRLSVFRVWNAALEMLEGGFLPVERGKERDGAQSVVAQVGQRSLRLGSVLMRLVRLLIWR